MPTTDRDRAIEEAIEEADADLPRHSLVVTLPALIIACQGPPECELEGDEALAAAKAGCVWCTRITCHEDGTRTVDEPARA